MPTEGFVASVKYNDWEGTSAADCSDFAFARDFLKEKGCPLKSDEFVLGISIYAGENRRGIHEDPIQVSFFLAKGSREALEAKLEPGEPVPIVREESALMDLAEFFGLFKRVNFKISFGGVLTARGIAYTS